MLLEEYRLRVFENRMLRRIFGPQRDEVTGGWRKLHNEELRNLKDEMDRHVVLIGEKRIAYRTLVGKPEEKRPLGRPRCRCADNIKVDLRTIE
jgi:hypothetical protein